MAGEWSWRSNELWEFLLLLPQAIALYTTIKIFTTYVCLCSGFFIMLAKWYRVKMGVIIHSHFFT